MRGGVAAYISVQVKLQLLEQSVIKRVASFAWRRTRNQRTSYCDAPFGCLVIRVYCGLRTYETEMRTIRLRLETEVSYRKQ